MRCLLEIIVARQADAYAVLKPSKDVAGLEFGVRLLNAIESSETIYRSALGCVLLRYANN